MTFSTLQYSNNPPFRLAAKEKFGVRVTKDAGSCGQSFFVEPAFSLMADQLPHSHGYKPTSHLIHYHSKQFRHEFMVLIDVHLVNYGPI